MASNNDELNFEIRLKRSKPRKGTGNKGQEYEILVAALFSLILFEDSDIKDFFLISNVNSLGAFDDLIISIDRFDNTKEKYAFQLKHKEKQNIALNPELLESEVKGDFALQKYCEGFCVISGRENYRYIVYTNAYLLRTNFTRFNAIKGTCPGKKYFFLSSDKNEAEAAMIYNFQETERTTFTDLATEEVYRSFFKKFAFYTSQKNWEEVQQLIIEKFQQMFQTNDKSIATAYIDIFKVWNLHEYSNSCLTKEQLKIKILDLIFTPYISPPSNRPNLLLEEAFSKFDFVIIKNPKEVEGKIGSNPKFGDEDILHVAKNMKFLTKQVLKKNFSKNKLLESEIKKKIGYYQKEQPIILKINDTNFDTLKTTIFKFKRSHDMLHFILLGEKIKREDLPNFKIFETLNDLLQEDIYFQLVKQMKIFVMGKIYTYHDLFKDNDEFAKQIKIEDMVQMLSGQLRFEVKQEELPESYIPRVLSTTLIKTESLEEITNDLLVISNVKSKKLPTFRQKNIIYEDTVSSEEFQLKNVHHFRGHNEEFVEWISSTGNIKELKKCEIVKKFSRHESEIHEKIQNKINVIVANPGTGKSEIMKKLANTCPSDFVPIKINLKEHNSFFTKNHSDEEVLEYFLADDNLLFLEIKKSLAIRKTLCLFFDGLDEIHGVNITNALDCIKQLSQMGFKVWVTSRPYLQETIENNLNVFPIDIKSFNEDEQKDYIRSRLQNKKNINNIIEEIFKNIDTILENTDILEIPLQLFMITEHLISRGSTITSSLFVLTQIFKNFVTGRYSHFFNKNKCRNVECRKSIEIIVNDSRIYRTRQYQVAALKCCLSEDEFRTLGIQQDEEFLKQIETNGDFLGIILRNTRSSVVFHHNMTAVYFAALWFAENYNSVGDFLKNILFKREYIHLRRIFDMILAEDFPSHVAVLYKNIEALKKCQIDGVDKGGRSTLHLACSHMRNSQNTEIGKMMTTDEEYRDIFNCLLDKEDLLKVDSVFGWNCLEFADRTDSLLFMEIILEKKHSMSEEVKKIILGKRHQLGLLNSLVALSYRGLFKILYEDSTLEGEEIVALFHLAAMWNSWKIAAFLLQLHDDIQHSRDKFERTPLHMACHRGHRESVILLLYKAADVNADDRFGRKPLHYAAAKGNIFVVRELCGANAQVDPRDKNGRTPLHLAVEKGHENLILYLLEERGASIDETSWNGFGPLHLAILKGHSKIVKLLLAKGANFDAVTIYGTKPIHLATRNFDAEILKELVKISENVDDLTSDGRTSLHVAAECGNIEAMEILLKTNVDINARDDDGKSVLHWSIVGENNKLIELLLKNKVDFTAVDNGGRNSLHWAAKTGDLTTVKLLLTKMSSLINDQANNGSTALHWAANNGNTGLVNFLISKGATIDVEDNQGRTPLNWAALEGHVETVELLLKKNARDVLINGTKALQFARNFAKRKLLN